MFKTADDHMKKFGFAIISDEDGMNAVAFTDSCSGSRSECCTRTCSADANFVENTEAWEQYLAVKGGQVQY